MDSWGVECGLKYVIHSPGDQPKLQMNMFTLSNGIMQVWLAYITDSKLNMVMKNVAPLGHWKVDYSRELVVDSVMQTSNEKVESLP